MQLLKRKERRRKKREKRDEAEKRVEVAASRERGRFVHEYPSIMTDYPSINSLFNQQTGYPPPRRDV